MATIRPKTGTERFRKIALATGEIERDELHATRDQKRLFLANEDGSEDEIIAPRHHGDIASEAAMLALVDSEHGCHRGDKCKRTDINCTAECVSNYGESLSDWLLTPYSSSTGGYGDTWSFVLEGGLPCLAYDANGNPHLAIEEITS